MWLQRFNISGYIYLRRVCEHLPEFRPWPTKISFRPVVLRMNVLFPEPVTPITAITTCGLLSFLFSGRTVVESCRGWWFSRRCIIVVMVTDRFNNDW